MSLLCKLVRSECPKVVMAQTILDISKTLCANDRNMLLTTLPLLIIRIGLFELINILLINVCNVCKNTTIKNKVYAESMTNIKDELDAMVTVFLDKPSKHTLLQFYLLKLHFIKLKS
jgi:hypothetical protein